jgi:hypothetical protein
MKAPYGKVAEAAPPSQENQILSIPERNTPEVRVSKGTEQKPTPQQILEQLERLLASSRFTSSPRCQTLLRYVVESTLRGNSDSLKERNIGVSLFKREFTYDTNSDPVVRVAASEIRKKLALYYHDNNDQDQVRIDLPPGTYAPVFSLPKVLLPNYSPLHSSSEALLESGACQSEPAQAEPAKTTLRWHRIKRLAVYSAICLAALAASSYAIWHFVMRDSAFDKFWAPVLNSPDPVLICIGQLNVTGLQFSPVAARNPIGITRARGVSGVYPIDFPVFGYDDVATLARVAGTLESSKKSFAILGEADTKYENMQKGPVILLGAFNNDWTIYMAKSLRYFFAENDDGYEWITDQMNPSAKIGLQKSDNLKFGPEEYSLLARILNPETKQPTLLVGGITPVGTFALGRLVTNPQTFNELMKSAPNGWQNKNIELLISMKVIENQPGPPRIVASTIW